MFSIIDAVENDGTFWDIIAVLISDTSASIFGLQLFGSAGVKEERKKEIKKETAHVKSQDPTGNQYLIFDNHQIWLLYVGANLNRPMLGPKQNFIFAAVT